MAKTNNHRFAQKLTAGLFYLIGLIWVVFSLVTALSSSSIMVWIFAAMMVANGLLLAWIGWGIQRGQKRYYWPAVILIALNIILTFTDQFGFYDLATLLIDILILGLLVIFRKQF